MEEERYLKYLESNAKEIQTICNNCLRYHDGAPCSFKKDEDPCEDFVPVNRKNTVYINNRWFLK